MTPLAAVASKQATYLEKGERKRGENRKTPFCQSTAIQKIPTMFEAYIDTGVYDDFV
jgi:hypothetical protein